MRRSHAGALMLELCGTRPLSLILLQHKVGLLSSVKSADHGPSSSAHSCMHSRVLHPSALGRASAAVPEPFSIQGACSEALHALFSPRGAPHQHSLLPFSTQGAHQHASCSVGHGGMVSALRRLRGHSPHLRLPAFTCRSSLLPDKRSWRRSLFFFLEIWRWRRTKRGPRETE